jgi:hypothetical protein
MGNSSMGKAVMARIFAGFYPPNEMNHKLA